VDLPSRRVEGPRAHAVLFLHFRPFCGWRRGENDVRVKKVLVTVLGLCKEMMIRGWELHGGERSRLEVWLRKRRGGVAVAGVAVSSLPATTRVAVSVGGGMSMSGSRPAS
jgi:hypothetical protein